MEIEGALIATTTALSSTSKLATTGAAKIAGRTPKGAKARAANIPPNTW
jgi:hypothetical protein